MHYSHFAFSEFFAALEKGRHEWDEVFEPVAHASEYDDTDVEARDVLLVRQILVRSDEHIVLSLRGSKQRAVLQPVPFPVMDRVDLVSRQMVAKPARN